MIKCLLLGHDLTHAIYRNPQRIMESPIFTLSFDNRVEVHAGGSFGFWHAGIVAPCQRCGKEIDAEDMNLPILEPDFDN